MRRRTYLVAAASASIGLAGCTDSTATSADALDRRTDDDADADADDGSPIEDSRTRPDAETIDDFEDLASWTVTRGTLEADANRALLGSQSARLEVPTDRGTTGIATTFDRPRDFADVVPGVAVAATDVVAPRIRLVDADGDAIDYRRRIADELPLTRHDFGVDEADPGFDATRVREIQLLLWTPDGDRPTVWFDDLHLTPRPETGTVLLQFDDGTVTDYTEALPILERYGYPAATFVNPGTVGDDRRLTVDQLRELRDAGWCVGNHTWSHARLPELDPVEQEAEIRAGRAWLVEQGFEDGADYFAYPFGRYDRTTLELVAEYHELGFAGGYPVHGSVTNPELIPRVGESTVERVRTELERTAELRGITTLFFHRLEGDDLEAFETLVETIHDYESRGDLEVGLPSDLEGDRPF